jgi:pimeloyl-ACP methyl ester carboxylesterase
MTALLGVILALSTAGAHPTLIEGRGDPARGLLVNRTIGTRPFDPPDPTRPTVVFIHGINPLPGIVRFSMAERLSEAIARRHGAGRFNILDWDWNAATLVGLRHRENTEAAIEQGRRLAFALIGAGIDLGRVHLVGHSAGGLVAASAARTIASYRGIRVAQVTLLEAASCTHHAIFRELAAAGTADRVENFWTPGPSAFGQVARVPGVIDVRVDHATPYSGVVIPSRSGHVGIVRWYVASVEGPERGTGFNTSLLLRR